MLPTKPLGYKVKSERNLRNHFLRKTLVKLRKLSTKNQLGESRSLYLHALEWHDKLLSKIPQAASC